MAKMAVPLRGNAGLPPPSVLAASGLSTRHPTEHTVREALAVVAAVVQPSLPTSVALAYEMAIEFSWPMVNESRWSSSSHLGAFVFTTHEDIACKWRMFRLKRTKEAQTKFETDTYSLQCNGGQTTDRGAESGSSPVTEPMAPPLIPA